MQDHHYRPAPPPHSPAHATPLPPFGSSRDHVGGPPGGIKRDPSESDALSQPRRPHSTGNATDGGLLSQAQHPLSAPPPGQTHPPPPPYGEDPRRGGGPHHQQQHQPPPPTPQHMSYDAGPQMGGPGPGGYRTPSYPPTPIVPPHGYDHGPYQVGPPQQVPDNMYNIQYSTTAKRKASRASQVGPPPSSPVLVRWRVGLPALESNKSPQACESCRNLKAKCDEMMPCKTCKEKGLDCKYRAPIQKQ